jgi:hypothetical protein
MFDDVLYAGTGAGREKAFTDLRQLLAVHETADEMFVHPRARQEIKHGDSIVDNRLQEEHSAKKQLAGMESMNIESDEFMAAVKALRDAVIEHAEKEEAFEFNKLQRELGADELKRMASAVRTSEAITPTRPHPGVKLR